MPRTKKTETKKAQFFSAIGRRKEAVARIRLYEGQGETIVNNKPIDQYFAGETAKSLYLRPFTLTKTEKKYFVTAVIVGGGLMGQLGAFVHGVSRALSRADRDKFRSSLKSKGLLTRDPRAKERRKVGTGGKARRRKQSPKR